MAEDTSNQGGNTQGQQSQTQPTKNPFLNRPANPELDILVQKGSDKRIIERKQERQEGTRITEQKRDRGKSSKE